MQHADEWQIAVAFGKIKSVADDKLIWNLEADIIRFYFFDTTSGFIEQYTGFNPARPKRAKFFKDAAHGSPGIEDVVHKQHVATANVEAQFFGENQIAGLRAAAVAGDAHEI